MSLRNRIGWVTVSAVVSDPRPKSILVWSEPIGHSTRKAASESIG